jgi:putative flavoprotein involved in K+ transport
VKVSDGNCVSADAIIFATGFEGPRESMRPILGDSVMSQVGPVWGLDEQGEIRGSWGRPCGHPRLWSHSGGMVEGRPYSRYVALQIAADEDGSRE